MIKRLVSNVSLGSFGGIGNETQSLTGSCHQLTVRYEDGEETNILIDLGAFQGLGDELNSTLRFDPSKIDAVVVTHGHIDHCGRLAMLFNQEKQFSGDIYATELTKKIAKLALLDSAKIFADTYKKKKNQYDKQVELHKDALRVVHADKKGVKRASNGSRNERHDERRSPETLSNARKLLTQNNVTKEADIYTKVQRPVPPIFEKEDVEIAIAGITCVGMSSQQETIWHPVCPEIDFSFWNAGHVAGSVSVVFRIYMGKSKTKHLFFSGDIGSSKIPFHPFGEAEVPGVPLDAVIMETTYGNRVRSDFMDGYRDFEDSIVKASKTRNLLVIPAFALDRAQAVLHSLVRMKKEGKFKGSIFLDSPLSVQYTKIYSENDSGYLDGMLEPNADTFTVISSDDREVILKEKGFKIIVTSSGMATGGPIVWYLQKFLKETSTSFFFMGYMAKGTIGQKLTDEQNPAKAIALTDDEGRVHHIEVFARVKRFNFFSGHADQSDLWNWYKSLHLKSRAKVVLIHGERISSTMEFKHFLMRRQKDNPEVMIPKKGNILVPDVNESNIL